MTPTQLLQQCKDEVAVKLSGSDFRTMCFSVHRYKNEKPAYDLIQKVTDEAALLFAKKMCEKQRKLCAEHLDSVKPLTAPLATEE